MYTIDHAVALHCIPNLSLERRLYLLEGSLSPIELIRRFAREREKFSLQSYGSFMRWLQEPVHHAVCFHDENYPEFLKEIPDAPLVLSYVGKSVQPRPCISIVGTRHATDRALRSAFNLGAECALSGLTVVSGYARGIDQAAHRGCQSCQGNTWAILGSGLDGLRTIRTDIVMDFLVHGGVFLSEFHPYAKPLPWRFPIRNRIISGISPVTVVIQAPSRSGALITARHALDQGRDVVVHRSGLDGDRGAGTRSLAEEGAPVISSLDDLLSHRFP